MHKIVEMKLRDSEKWSEVTATQSQPFTLNLKKKEMLQHPRQMKPWQWLQGFKKKRRQFKWKLDNTREWPKRKLCMIKRPWICWRRSLQGVRKNFSLNMKIINTAILHWVVSKVDSLRSFCIWKVKCPLQMTTKCGLLNLLIGMLKVQKSLCKVYWVTSRNWMPKSKTWYVKWFTTPRHHITHLRAINT